MSGSSIATMKILIAAIPVLPDRKAETILFISLRHIYNRLFFSINGLFNRFGDISPFLFLFMCYQNFLIDVFKIK